MSDLTPEKTPLPRRIEAEDLLPGDVFEYEHVTWGILYDGPGQYDNPRRTPERGYVKGQRRVMQRDTVRGRLSYREKQLVTAPVAPNSRWWDHEDEESVRRSDMTFIATVQGSNNHGYVVLRPKTVVVLLDRVTPPPGGVES